MFMAMLRVEIVDEVIWSRELMLASWPKVKSPPTWGHLHGAAAAGSAAITAATARVTRTVRLFIQGPPMTTIRRGLCAACRHRDETAGGRQGQRPGVEI